MLGMSARGGMKSVTRTVPPLTSHSVTRTREASRYERRVARRARLGAMSQRPLSGVPSSAAKQAPESNRGRHSQSIDPSMPTSAAVWVSPMSA